MYVTDIYFCQKYNCFENSTKAYLSKIIHAYTYGNAVF